MIVNKNPDWFPETWKELGNLFLVLWCGTDRFYEGLIEQRLEFGSWNPCQLNFLIIIELSYIYGALRFHFSYFILRNLRVCYMMCHSKVWSTYTVLGPNHGKFGMRYPLLSKFCSKIYYWWMMMAIEVGILTFLQNPLLFAIVVFGFKGWKLCWTNLL